MARNLITNLDCKATPLKQGLVAWWLGPYAIMPAGWEIANGAAAANDGTYTRPNLLGYFPKGVTNAGDAAGTATAASAHGHTVASHVHATSAQSTTTTGEDIGGEGRAALSHTHGDSGATASTLQNATPEPSYIDGIPIVYTMPAGGAARGLLTKNDFAASALPDRKIIGAWYGAAGSVPDGWSKCDGSTVNGVVTPNLLGRYLRGIPTSATAPGSTGGANTHTHNVAHGHGTGGPSATASSFGGTTVYATSGHTHTLKSAGGTSDAQNHEPSRITSHFIIFTGHGSNAAAHARGIVSGVDVAANMLIPRGTVFAWTDAIANIPANYSQCVGGAFNNGNPTGYASKPDIRSLILRHTANATTNGGGTGGSDTHTHAGTDHSHTISSGGAGTHVENNSGDMAAEYHTHSSSGTTYGDMTADNKPTYTEVAWLIRD